MMTARLSRGFRIRAGQLWRAIAFSRTVIPTPQSYTAAAGIGLVAGVIWNLLLGWPWWLGPVGFVVASWLLTLSTAFRGPQRAGTIRAVHDQLRPAGSKDRHDEQVRRDIDEMSFSAVGFAVHAESPRLGGISHNQDRLTGITITYGDPRIEASPFVEVTTMNDDDPPEMLLHMEEGRLRSMAAGPSHLPTSDPSMLSAEIGWSSTEAVVDDVPRTAQWAKLGDSWSLVIEDTPDRTVVLNGYRSATLGTPILMSLDPSDYITGRSF